MRFLRNMSWMMLIAAVASCFSAAARADDTPASAGLPILNVVPADALAVGIINQVKVADAKIHKLSTLVGAGPVGLLDTLKATEGGLQGLDENGSAALVMLPKEDGSDGMAGTVIFIPTTDYKRFIGTYQPDDDSAAIAEIKFHGLPTFVGKKGTFAVFTEKAGPEERKLLERVLANSEGIASKLEPLAGWIAEHEASFMATAKGVKLGLANARKGLQSSKAAMAANEQTKAAASMFDAFDGFLKQAEHEVTTFAVGAHVEEDATVHIDSRIIWIADGKFAAAAKNIRHPTDVPVSDLPPGPFLFAFDGELPESFSRGIMNMSLGILQDAGKAAGATKLTEEQSKKLADLAQESMQGVHSISMVMGTPKPGVSIYDGMAAVYKVEDSQKYLDRYQKSMAMMSELRKTLNNPLIPSTPTEIKQMKVEGLPTLEVTMDLSKAMVAQPNPAARKMMESWLGKDGMLKAYLAAVDDKTVAMGFVSAANLSRAISACKNPQTSLSSDPNVAETAQLLWRDAQWIAYLSPKGFMDFSMAMAMQAAPPGAMPQLPAFPETPPIGFGVAANPASLNAQIVLPARMLRSYANYFRGISQMLAPRPQPGKGS